MAKHNQNDARQKISLAPVKTLSVPPAETSKPVAAPAKTPSLQASQQEKPAVTVAEQPKIEPKADIVSPAAKPVTTKVEPSTSPLPQAASSDEIKAKSPAVSGSEPKAIVTAAQPPKSPALEKSVVKKGVAKAAISGKACVDIVSGKKPVSKPLGGKQLSKAEPPVAKAALPAVAVVSPNPPPTPVGVVAGQNTVVEKNAEEKTRGTAPVSDTSRLPKSIQVTEAPLSNFSGRPQSETGLNVLKLKSARQRHPDAISTGNSAVKSVGTTPKFTSTSSPTPASAVMPLPIPAIAIALPGVTAATTYNLMAPVLRTARLYVEAHNQVLDHLMEEFSATLADAEEFTKARSPSEIAILQAKALRRRIESGNANASDLAQIASKFGNAA